eukprot:scaffold7369_cov61-Phaeocystis_antarctica.AAC.5
MQVERRELGAAGVLEQPLRIARGLAEGLAQVRLGDEQRQRVPERLCQLKKDLARRHPCQARALRACRSSEQAEIQPAARTELLEQRSVSSRPPRTARKTTGQRGDNPLQRSCLAITRLVSRDPASGHGRKCWDSANCRQREKNYGRSK